MRKHFITYGNEFFEGAKARIVREAKSTGEFDVIKAYGPKDVSDEVRSLALFSARRGGGYWCWKPDIMVQELHTMEIGDILVYVDSGCELVPGRGWNRYWRLLEEKDLIAQRIYQVNEKWTRHTIVEEFSDNPKGWLKGCQFLCGIVIVKKSSDSLAFFDEWRAYMIQRPDMVCDVKPEEMAGESPMFIENRHDQAIFTALVYRYMRKGFIACRWENVENQSVLISQVIRAMRNRTGDPIPFARRMREIALRLGKDSILKPYYIVRMLLQG